jgi:sugar/nucleoside kinase (ribokinase family)
VPALCAAIPAGTFRVADSQVASRWGNILDFKGFDLITPNEKEARFALGDQDTVVRPLGSRLYEEARCRTLILKLGARGLIAFRRPIGDEDDRRTFFALDSFAGNADDPMGTGDALLAYATLAIRGSGNEVIGSVLGALAAAVECELDGNVPVSPEDVGRKLDELEQSAAGA